MKALELLASVDQHGLVPSVVSYYIEMIRRWSLKYSIHYFVLNAVDEDALGEGAGAAGERRSAWIGAECRELRCSG